jgi:cyclic pyranopterin monophosphate synthase
MTAKLSKEKLSHVDGTGKARMVEVGNKEIQYRVAKATGNICLSAKTIKLVRENKLKKGSVLEVAEFAGIQAAKQTPGLIPLCHPLLLSQVLVAAKIERNGIRVDSEVHCNGQTGVEMEALTAVAVALLTVYDMCKAADKNMTIGQVHLVSKTKSPAKPVI